MIDFQRVVDVLGLKRGDMFEIEVCVPDMDVTVELWTYYKDGTQQAIRAYPVRAAMSGCTEPFLEDGVLRGYINTTHRKFRRYDPLNERTFIKMLEIGNHFECPVCHTTNRWGTSDLGDDWTKAVGHCHGYIPDGLGYRACWYQWPRRNDDLVFSYLDEV